MTLLVDTSVVVKWFHADGEPEVEQSRLLLAAHQDGRETLLVLDLVVYELGNVLLRALKGTASDVTQALDLLLKQCGPVVHPRPSWLRRAADLGAEHGLTFYDASWAAAAEALGCPLVSADRRLLGAGLAVSPTQAAAALRRR